MSNPHVSGVFFDVMGEGGVAARLRPPLSGLSSPRSHFFSQPRVGGRGRAEKSILEDLWRLYTPLGGYFIGWRGGSSAAWFEASEGFGCLSFV